SATPRSASDPTFRSRSASTTRSVASKRSHPMPPAGSGCCRAMPGAGSASPTERHDGERMSKQEKIPCALIGPGNIGTDLLAKLMRSEILEPRWMVGVDESSEGLRRARELGLRTTAEGV